MPTNLQMHPFSYADVPDNSRPYSKIRRCVAVRVSWSNVNDWGPHPMGSGYLTIRPRGSTQLPYLPATYRPPKSVFGPEPFYLSDSKRHTPHWLAYMEAMGVYRYGDPWDYDTYLKLQPPPDTQDLQSRLVGWLPGELTDEYGDPLYVGDQWYADAASGLRLDMFREGEYSQSPPIHNVNRGGPLLSRGAVRIGNEDVPVGASGHSRLEMGDGRQSFVLFFVVEGTSWFPEGLYAEDFEVVTDWTSPPMWLSRNPRFDLYDACCVECDDYTAVTKVANHYMPQRPFSSMEGPDIGLYSYMSMEGEDAYDYTNPERRDYLPRVYAGKTAFLLCPAEWLDTETPRHHSNVQLGGAVQAGPLAPILLKDTTIRHEGFAPGSPAIPARLITETFYLNSPDEIPTLIRSLRSAPPNQVIEFRPSAITPRLEFVGENGEYVLHHPGTVTLITGYTERVPAVQAKAGKRIVNRHEGWNSSAVLLNAIAERDITKFGIPSYSEGVIIGFAATGTTKVLTGVYVTHGDVHIIENGVTRSAPEVHVESLIDIAIEVLQAGQYVISMPDGRGGVRHLNIRSASAWPVERLQFVANLYTGGDAVLGLSVLRPITAVSVATGSITQGFLGEDGLIRDQNGRIIGGELVRSDTTPTTSTSGGSIEVLTPGATDWDKLYNTIAQPEMVDYRGAQIILIPTGGELSVADYLFDGGYKYNMYGDPLPLPGNLQLPDPEASLDVSGYGVSGSGGGNFIPGPEYAGQPVPVGYNNLPYWGFDGWPGNVWAPEKPSVGYVGGTGWQDAGAGAGADDSTPPETITALDGLSHRAQLHVFADMVGRAYDVTEPPPVQSTHASHEALLFGVLRATGSERWATVHRAAFPPLTVNARIGEPRGMAYGHAAFPGAHGFAAFGTVSTPEDNTLPVPQPRARADAQPFEITLHASVTIRPSDDAPYPHWYPGDLYEPGAQGGMDEYLEWLYASSSRQTSAPLWGGVWYSRGSALIDGEATHPSRPLPPIIGSGVVTEGPRPDGYDTPFAFRVNSLITLGSTLGMEGYVLIRFGTSGVIESLITFELDSRVQLNLQEFMRLVTTMDMVVGGSQPAGPDTAARTWVVNARTGAVSRYEDFAFTSFARIGSTMYATREDGVYALYGDSDAGQAIEWAIRTGQANFESQQRKRMPTIYVAGDNPNALTVTVTVHDPSNEDLQSSYSYAARRSTVGTGVQRIDTGRGLIANYFTLELSGVAPASVDELTPMIEPTARRV